MKSPAIKEDEVSGLRVNLDAIFQGFLFLIFLGNQKPILFIILHFLFNEVLAMIEIGSRHADKASFIFACIGQSHNPLVTPDFVLGGRLVNVQEGVDGDWLVVPGSVHEAKTVEGAFEVLGLP